MLSTAISLADDTALYNDPNRINTEYEKRLAVTAPTSKRPPRRICAPANRVIVVTSRAAAAAPSPPAAKQN